MQIHAEHSDGIEHLRFEGSFDTTDMAEFQAHVARAMEAGRVRVVVNMAKARFVNSRSLGSLLIAQTKLNEGGGDLVVAELDGFPQSVFKTLGMNRKILCFDTEAEAVSHLSPAAE